MSQLFTPIRIRGLELKNRVAAGPIATYSAVAGMAGEWHLTHLARLAAGGVGLVFYEAAAIMRQARLTQGGAGLWQDEHVTPLLRITEFLRHHGVASAVQLAHATHAPVLPRPWDEGNGGDAAAVNAAFWNLTPESNAAAPVGPPVHELGAAYIGGLLEAYELAARRALEARFDALEIHGGIGGLLHEFLSARSNRRGDEYGGDLESRMRLPLEVVERVREVWPRERPLMFRLASLDSAELGWRMADSLALGRALAEAGVDILDLASGGLPLVPAGAQAETAKRLRAETGLRVMVGGGVREPAEAEAALADGAGDLVALARALLWDPNWPLRAARALGDDADCGLWPSPYGWPLQRWRE